MRISEAVALRVADIDSREMTILVARGKGNKQRLVPLSSSLLEELRAWWQTHHHPQRIMETAAASSG
jgi:integrase/recombinase XerD